MQLLLQRMIDNPANDEWSSIWVARIIIACHYHFSAMLRAGLASPAAAAHYKKVDHKRYTHPT